MSGRPTLLPWRKTPFLRARSDAAFFFAHEFESRLMIGGWPPAAACFHDSGFRSVSAGADQGAAGRAAGRRFSAKGRSAFARDRDALSADAARLPPRARRLSRCARAECGDPAPHRRDRRHRRRRDRVRRKRDRRPRGACARPAVLAEQHRAQGAACATDPEMGRRHYAGQRRAPGGEQSRHRVRPGASNSRDCSTT